MSIHIQSSSDNVSSIKQTQETIIASQMRWEIRDFKSIESGSTIESRKINNIPHLNDVSWMMILESYSNHSTCITTKIDVESEDIFKTPNDIQYSISVTDLSGELQFYPDSYAKLEKDSYSFTSISHPKVCEKMFDNGSLILMAHLRIKFSKPFISECVTDFNNSTDVANQLTAKGFRLYKNSKYTDFTFVARTKKFKIHRAIFADESEAFDRIFSVGVKGKIFHEFIVKETPEIFEHLIKFVYTKRLPERNVDVYLDLYDAADYYEMEHLKKLCQQKIAFKLRNSVSNETVMKIYEFAVKYELEDLIQDSWFIIKHDILKIFVPIINEPLSLEAVYGMMKNQK